MNRARLNEMKWIEWIRMECASKVTRDRDSGSSKIEGERIGDEIEHKNECVLHLYFMNAHIPVHSCSSFSTFLSILLSVRWFLFCFSVEFVRRAIPTIG